MADATIQDLIEAVQLYGFEYVFKRYYGLYDAEVISNKDPEGKGRVQIFCPIVGHVKGSSPQTWVTPAFESAGQKHGAFNPPEQGDCVRVNFKLGDPAKPDFYLGGWFTKAEMPTEFKYSDSGFPERRGLVTRGGHHLLFCDEPGKELVRLMWHKAAAGDPSASDRTVAADTSKGDFSSVALDDKGSVSMINKDSSFFKLDAEAKQAILVLHKSDGKAQTIVATEDNIMLLDSEGDCIEINSSTKAINIISAKIVNIAAETVNLKGGGIHLGDAAAVSAVLGEPLLAWLASHTHGTNVGPSTLPIVPPPPAILSQKVKLA